jgi:hypothetical protein
MLSPRWESQCLSNVTFSGLEMIRDLTHTLQRFRKFPDQLGGAETARLSLFAAVCAAVVVERTGRTYVHRVGERTPAPGGSSQVRAIARSHNAPIVPFIVFLGHFKAVDSLAGAASSELSGKCPVFKSDVSPRQDELRRRCRTQS